MQIAFNCPAGHKLQARPEKAGSQMTCPVCGAAVVVPDPESAIAGPAAPAQIAGAGDPEVPIGASPPSIAKSAVAKRPQGEEETRAQADQPSTATDRRRIVRPPMRQETVSGPRASHQPPPLPKGSPSSGGKETSGPPPLGRGTVQQVWAALAPRWRWLKSTLARGTRAATLVAREISAGHDCGVRADRRDRHAVYWLGLGLALIAILEMVPALGHNVVASGPFWTRLVLLVALMQLVYVVWMVSLPDFSTVEVAAIVYACAAGIHLLAATLSLLTTEGRGLMFQLAGFPRLTPAWCAAMLALTLAGAWLARRLSIRLERSLQRSTAATTR